MYRSAHYLRSSIPGTQMSAPFYMMGPQSGLCHSVRYWGSWGIVLPVHTTNQQAEIIALTYAFQLSQGQPLNIYTDSKHAFHIILSHAAIWEREHTIYNKGGIDHKERKQVVLLAHCLPHSGLLGTLGDMNPISSRARLRTWSSRASVHPPCCPTVQSREAEGTRKYGSIMDCIIQTSGGKGCENVDIRTW